MAVIAKFTCNAKTQRKNWNADPNHPFLYEYEFQPVTGNSEENKAFFASTPSGKLAMSAVGDDLFQPGKEYYLEFRPAE